MMASRPLPASLSAWFEEILLAVADAAEAKSFGMMVGEEITDNDLFHLAPLVCLKFRGRKTTGKEAKRVTEIALANYVLHSSPKGVDRRLWQNPMLAFAVCYVASHLALDLVDEDQADAILNYCQERFDMVGKKKAASKTAKKTGKMPSKTKGKPNPIQGYWRITWMEAWDQDYIDEDEEGHFEFDAANGGTFRFGYVFGEMDCKMTTRDGKPCVEFSWEGNSEMDQALGRGWAVVDGNQLEGTIFFHQGDDSTFQATRMAKVR